MEEGLSIDNILGSEDIDNLFVDIEDNDSTDTPSEETPKEGDNNKENKEIEKETTEVNVEDLFAEPESVGSGKDDKEVKEDTTLKGSGSSPNNFYSSIAKALKEEGIFPDLDDNSYSQVKNPEDFRALVEQQIQQGLDERQKRIDAKALKEEGIFPDLDDNSYSQVKNPEDFRALVEQQIQQGLDERQKRIDAALNANLEPDVIKQYESTVNYLDNISEDNITAEDAEGENLRKQLIYQDYINRGFNKERALRETQKSLDNGTDVDDAKEALKSNKDFFINKYNKLVEDAEKEQELEQKEKQKQAEDLKNSILNDKEIFGELVIDKTTRQKIYDNIAKPIYKDQETGQFYTALQKYEKENKTDFLKNLSLIFTLTNGFKDMDGLIKGKVKREVNKGLRELENTLNNTARTSDGSLKFTSGVDEDPESFIGKGWKLDV